MVLRDCVLRVPGDGALAGARLEGTQPVTAFVQIDGLQERAATLARQGGAPNVEELSRGLR